ncbi:hypothetical protein FYF33_20160 [Salmonella enterica]|nr:hypothetical protein [Salmonella enterica]
MHNVSDWLVVGFFFWSLFVFFYQIVCIARAVIKGKPWYLAFSRKIGEKRSFIGKIWDMFVSVMFLPITILMLISILPFIQRKAK